jgi:hypothetical protein
MATYLNTTHASSRSTTRERVGKTKEGEMGEGLLDGRHGRRQISRHTSVDTPRLGLYPPHHTAPQAGDGEEQKLVAQLESKV